MQIRKQSFSGERPGCPGDCPLCHGCGKLHRHGSYERYATPEGECRVLVQRYLCVGCARTFSVIEDLMPYRALPVELLESHLDVLTCGLGSAPPQSERERGCLNRAVGRMVQRAEVLRAAAGLMIVSHNEGPATLWRELKGAFGGLEKILLFLAKKINASLLGDYRCLRGWWTLVEDGVILRRS